MASSRREHLVDTATQLFSRHGYRATGIDTILAEAGVAKMTLYNHFKSKDDLILASLRRSDEQTRAHLAQDIAARGGSARQRLLAVFEDLARWVEEPAFNGCLFIKAAADYPDARDPIHALAAEHKRLVRGFLEGLAREAGAEDPAALAWQLQLLFDGATVQAQVCGGSGAAAQALEAAERLIDAATPSAPGI